MAEHTVRGASVWEQQIYSHIIGHMEREREVLTEYEALTRDASPALAFLAGLILDDERRHHQLLRDLADAVRKSAELSPEPTPIPGLASLPADRERILAITERFLAVEEEDNEELEWLDKALREVRDTMLWQLVVRLMQLDNSKHRRILEFIRDGART
jgi:hypothetical protein